MQAQTIQPNTPTAQRMPSFTVIGGISQLSCKKPLSSFFPYNVIICKEGVLFIKETLGEVMKVAGILGAGGATGLIGYAIARRSANKSMNNQLSQASELDVMRQAAVNPRNFWLPAAQISSITLKKSTFVHKVTFVLRDGTVLQCGSKAGYNQWQNIQLVKQAFPALAQEL